MVELTDDLGELADSELWEEAAVVAGSYLGSSVLQMTVESRLPDQIPNEAYGLGVAYLGTATETGYTEEIALGGGLYTIDALAQRLELKGEIEGMM